LVLSDTASSVVKNECHSTRLEQICNSLVLCGSERKIYASYWQQYCE